MPHKPPPPPPQFDEPIYRTRREADGAARATTVRAALFAAAVVGLSALALAFQWRLI